MDALGLDFGTETESKKINVDNEIIKISGREIKLYPFPPPGSDKIVEKR